MCPTSEPSSVCVCRCAYIYIRQITLRAPGLLSSRILSCLQMQYKDANKDRNSSKQAIVFSHLSSCYFRKYNTHIFTQNKDQGRAITPHDSSTGSMDICLNTISSNNTLRHTPRNWIHSQAGACIQKDVRCHLHRSRVCLSSPTVYTSTNILSLSHDQCGNISIKQLIFIINRLHSLPGNRLYVTSQVNTQRERDKTTFLYISMIPFLLTREQVNMTTGRCVVLPKI